MSYYAFEMKGNDLLAKILAVADQPEFMTAIAGAAYQEASAIMLMAKAQVPLEFGTLRASGVVEEPVITGTTWSVTLGFGGAASAYALIQHEDLTFNHPGLQSKITGQVGRGPKYLEEPVAYDVPTFEANLTKRVVKYFADKQASV